MTNQPTTTSSKTLRTDSERLRFLLDRCHCYTGSPQSILFRLTSAESIDETMDALREHEEEIEREHRDRMNDRDHPADRRDPWTQ